MNIIKIISIFFLLLSNLYAEERKFLFTLSENNKNDFEVLKNVNTKLEKKFLNSIPDVSIIEKSFGHKDLNKSFFTQIIKEKKFVIKFFLNLDDKFDYHIYSDGITEVNLIKTYNIYNIYFHNNSYQKAQRENNFFSFSVNKKGLYYLVVHGKKKNVYIYKTSKDNYSIVKNCFKNEGKIYNYVIISKKKNEVICIKTTKYLLGEIITLESDYEIYNNFFYIKKL
jgi:hypothetical protein